MQQPLTSNEDLAGPPVDIVELESNDLSSTESEAGEQKKDRIVAAAGRTFDGRSYRALGRLPPE